VRLPKLSVKSRATRLYRTGPVDSALFSAVERAEHDRATRVHQARAHRRHGPGEAARLHRDDRRTAAARALLDFKRDLISALGGEADLSPQRRRLIDMAARADVLLSHVDAWIMEQTSVVNSWSRTLAPVVVQRTALADHLARLLDKLGLDRVPQRVPTLAEYLSSKSSQNGAPGGAAASPRPVTAAPDAGAGDDSGEADLREGN
jgi:hypothetical protein